MRKLPAAFLLLPIMVLLLNGCTEPLEDGLPGSDSDNSTYHSTGWKDNPQHGNEFSTNPQNCEACHGADLKGGSSGTSCVSCHHGWDTGGMEAGPDCFTPGCHVESQSHTTHFDAQGKGPGILTNETGCSACHEENVMEMKVGACDPCHSPGGAFGGVAMAKANWSAGIYETDGATLQSGKEQWCATCHDDQQANSQADGTGINAPNVIGDNSIYGFYVTGHEINCLSCHDASKKHIDHEHRTYELDEGSGNAVVNPYSESYRLQGTNTKPSKLFCYNCHNRVEIEGQSSSDVSHTNFWHNDASIENSHWLHFVAQTGIQFDSDWDGTHDAPPSCVTCHNVHGGPSYRMIRHGELISDYGTTNKVPALNFGYLVPPSSFATATWTPKIVQAGDYDVYAWWKSSANRATNAKYTIYYSGGSQSVEVNQEIDDSQWNLLGNFPFAEGTLGYVELTNEGADEYVMADAVGWDFDSDGTPDIIINNSDPEFDSVGDWTCTSGSGGYEDDHCWHAKPTPVPDPDATLVESAGGRMNLLGGGIAQNGVCWACHGAMSYERTPYLGPKVLMGKAEPNPVANDGSGSTLITAYVLDHDDDPMDITVTIDLSPIGGSSDQAMNYDGNGIFSYQLTIPADTPDTSLSFVITATDDAMNTAEGAATVIVVYPDSIYVDNADVEFVCNWDGTVSGGYGGDFRWHAAGDGSCTATWRPDISQADTYNVYAWWKASSNRATNAPYTIYYDGGSQTVKVNQEINGSQWNYLGNFSFAAGTSGYVVLSDEANEYVIADAVKFEP